MSDKLPTVDEILHDVYMKGSLLKPFADVLTQEKVLLNRLMEKREIEGQIKELTIAKNYYLVRDKLPFEEWLDDRIDGLKEELSYYPGGEEFLKSLEATS